MYCDKCRSKISTETHTHYYRLMGSSDKCDYMIGHKYCSEECTEKDIENMLYSIFIHLELYPGRGVIYHDPDDYRKFRQWRIERESIVGQVKYRISN